MRVVFLGTASMVPTKHRNVSSVFCEHLGDCYLFDCGEGTQRQMNIAGLNRHRVDTVLVSHWHGDHVSGLIGLLQTKDKVPEPEDVTIIGPAETERRVSHLLQSCYFNLSYDVEVVEVPQEGGTIYHGGETVVEAAYLDHGVPCVGYAVREQAKRRVDMEALREEGVAEGPHIGDLQNGEEITVDGETYSPETYTYVPEQDVVAYTVDSRPCPAMKDVAESADLLIAESTFTDEFRERADNYHHMTARQAGRIAREAGVDTLCLTHFSQRFQSTEELVAEAGEEHGRVRAAHDFLELDVPVREEEGSS